MYERFYMLCCSPSVRLLVVHPQQLSAEITFLVHLTFVEDGPDVLHERVISSPKLRDSLAGVLDWIKGSPVRVPILE